MRARVEGVKVRAHVRCLRGVPQEEEWGWLAGEMAGGGSGGTTRVGVPRFNRRVL